MKVRQLRSTDLSLREEVEFKPRETGQGFSWNSTEKWGHVVLRLVGAPEFCFVSLVCSPEDRAQGLTLPRQASPFVSYTQSLQL